MIPMGVETIGNATFANCLDLQSVQIPESVKAIGPNAFYKCTALKEIKLPSSLTALGDEEYGVFDGCDNLEAIYCPVSDPAQIATHRGVELGGHQATLYVPAGSVAAYKKKAVWKKFAAIKPIPEYSN